MTFYVTLANATGSREIEVRGAEDEFHARQIAIRRHVGEGEAPMWVSKVESR